MPDSSDRHGVAWSISGHTIERKLWYLGELLATDGRAYTTGGRRCETRRTLAMISATVADRPETMSFVTWSGEAERESRIHRTIRRPASCECT